MFVPSLASILSYRLTPRPSLALNPIVSREISSVYTHFTRGISLFLIVFDDENNTHCPPAPGAFPGVIEVTRENNARSCAARHASSRRLPPFVPHALEKSDANLLALPPSDARSAIGWGTAGCARATAETALSPGRGEGVRSLPPSRRPPTRGMLTPPPFALTILRIMHICGPFAGFFRPDHDPPFGLRYPTCASARFTVSAHCTGG